jgi:hypothetical protein
MSDEDKALLSSIGDFDSSTYFIDLNSYDFTDLA